MTLQNEFQKYFNLYGKHYEKFSKYTKSEILSYREEKLQEIFDYVVKESEFYHELYWGININQVTSPEVLPIINKKTLIEQFEKIVTSKDINKASLKEYFAKPFKFDRRYLNKFLAFHTSGSTGYPAYIVWGEREFAISTANYYFKLSSHILNQLQKVQGCTDDQFRIAYIGILDDYVGGNSWAYAMKNFAELRMLSVFSSIDKLCSELDDFKPNIIMTKPSLLGELARKKRDGELSIELKQIIFTGEMLSPNDARNIEKYFGTKARNSYSTCETGPIAFQMNNQIEGLDIFEDLVWLELVDDENRPINQYYKLGNIVVSNLYNKTMPILRYKLGDKAYYIPGVDESHLNRISYILGRDTSFFLFQNNKGEEVRVSEYPFWSLYVSGIIRYQVFQYDFRNLKIKVQLEDAISLRDKEKIFKEMGRKIYRILAEKNGLDAVNVSFEEVEKIEPKKSGKIQITFPFVPTNI